MFAFIGWVIIWLLVFGGFFGGLQADGLSGGLLVLAVLLANYLLWKLLVKIGVFLFSFGEAVTNKSEAVTNKSAQKQREFEVRLKALLNQHQVELARRKRQLMQVGSYGVKDDSKWAKEREYFLLNVLRKDVEFEAIYSQIATPELMSDIYRHIDSVADRSELYAVVEEDIDSLSPLDFEHYCAAVMHDAGWEAAVTQATGDQGVDVIAVKNGVRVVLQCKKYSSPVGNKAVQEIAAGKIHEQAHHAAVVTNASFTPSARQLANTTGVKLLHVSELSEYANNIGREVLPGGMS